MNAIIIPRSLADAAISRDEAIEKARQDFDRVVEKAGRAGRQRVNAAKLQYENAARLARQVSGIRKGLWREHHELPISELLSRLALHEFRLSPVYASQNMRSPQIRAELWYVRMIHTELANRQPGRETSQKRFALRRAKEEVAA